MNSQWDSISEFEFRISLAIYCTCATQSYVVAVNQPENLCTPVFRSVVLLILRMRLKELEMQIDLGACANLIGQRT